MVQTRTDGANNSPTKGSQKRVKATPALPPSVPPVKKKKLDEAKAAPEADEEPESEMMSQSFGAAAPFHPDFDQEGWVQMVNKIIELDTKLMIKTKTHKSWSAKLSVTNAAKVEWKLDPRIRNNVDLSDDHPFVTK
jgi:hypothetical protein